MTIVQDSNETPEGWLFFVAVEEAFISGKRSSGANSLDSFSCLLERFLSQVYDDPTTRRIVWLLVEIVCKITIYLNPVTLGLFLTFLQINN